MDSYTGPATVTAGTSTISAHATLRTDRSQFLTSWAGRLEFDSVGDAWTVFDATQAELALPSGRTGTIIVTHHSGGSALVTVQGSGPAPY